MPCALRIGMYSNFDTKFHQFDDHPRFVLVYLVIILAEMTWSVATDVLQVSYVPLLYIITHIDSVRTI